MSRLKRYLWNLLIALDQLANTLLAGWPDETLSARTHRKAESLPCGQSQSIGKGADVPGQWFWRMLRGIIDFVMLWDCRNHCRVSYERELTRAQMPTEYRR